MKEKLILGGALVLAGGLAIAITIQHGNDAAKAAHPALTHAVSTASGPDWGVVFTDIGIGAAFVALVVLAFVVHNVYDAWYHRRQDRLERGVQTRALNWSVMEAEAEQKQRHRKEMHFLLWQQQQEELKHEMELAKIALERDRLHLTLRDRALIPEGDMMIWQDQTTGERAVFTNPRSQKQLAGPKDQEPEAESFVKPEAPHFNEMCHMIADGRMPLCFIHQGGRCVPVYGTIDDLLSMSITGKPGRGKTTALMYFVAALLKCGAEVFVWDPHGVMAPLAMLNGRKLPDMPATAKVTYVDRKADIIASVPKLHALLNVRDEEYRQCVKVGRKYVKHPLLLLADELPVLADYDDDVEAEYKLINKQRKSDEKDPIDAPLQMKLIRKFVM